MSGTFLRNWKLLKPTKPPTPPDHFISTFTEELQQSLFGGNTEDIQIVLKVYDLQLTTCLDFLKFDHTELMKLVSTARKSIDTKFYPTAQPNHLISILLTQIKQATLDNDLESLNTLLHLSRRYWDTSIYYWYEVYDYY